MAELPNQSINTGLYVPTTNIWDVQEIQKVDVNSEEFKELLVRLYQNINVISLALNLKESAYYVEQEFLTSQLFPPASTSLDSEYRPSYRKYINFGALPNTATKSVAHGLTFDTATTATRIYGAATDPAGVTLIPLPYASPVLNNNIELWIDGTNVNVKTGTNRTNFTRSGIIIEVLKF